MASGKLKKLDGASLRGVGPLPDSFAGPALLEYISWKVRAESKTGALTPLSFSGT